MRAGLLAGLAVVALAGCGGSPAPPVHSASAACRDFQDWFLAQDGNIRGGKDAALLRAAVAEAPSGHLYEAMSILRTNVTYTETVKARSLAIAARTITLTDAQGVQQDCQSVNPG